MDTGKAVVAVPLTEAEVGVPGVIISKETGLSQAAGVREVFCTGKKCT
ncbi:MAG: hypothetical protein HY871_07405 [Chloroflexi bacterium]|nr:hypothetical protein [Chloroflexota bacterium]